MGKIVWMMGTSLDGYMEGPGREIDWHQVDEEMHLHFNEYIGGLAGILSGRVTWELMTDYWPAAARDPELPGWARDFADIWVKAPKVVYSRSLPAGPAAYGSTVVPEIVPAEVERLKAAGDLVVGGADVGNAFYAAGLVDVVRVYVHPVLVGTGKPMFAHEGRAFAPEYMTLRESRVFGNGVVLLNYDLPARP